MRSTTMLVNKTNLLCWVFFMISIATIFFSSTTASTTTCLGDEIHTPTKCNGEFQNVNEKIEQGMVSQGESEVPMVSSRRLLIGSQKPLCDNKCMQCTPCTPFLTWIPRKQDTTPNIYYQQIWKCKCHNKLYDP
ncbi:unnamed protein product [Trifolium pratense]|uniref:Uncharacterized protein n=1 Tax=Trifolium pratense TaxID=57577 RepID=A0ACB0JMB0_TRIPR|nr:unnamed protein product [Trifolium pratense]